MNLKTPALVAVLALAAGSVAVGKSPADRPSCLKRMNDQRGVLIESNSKAIVWGENSGWLLACSRASRRVTRIGVYPYTRVADVQGNFVLSARYVDERYVEVSSTLQTYDIRTGKLTAWTHGSDYPLRARITKGGGLAAAASARPPYPGAENDAYIFVVRPGGVREVLDSSVGVRPNSLAVAGHRIYWMNATGVQTAALGQ